MIDGAQARPGAGPSGPSRPFALKVAAGDADVTGIMAEADRTPRHRSTTEPRSLPTGLLERLTAPGGKVEIRLDEVARARQHMAERAFDDGAVVEEIAGQLLALSAR